jgi:Tfp pilus assembly protein PilX
MSDYDPYRLPAPVHAPRGMMRAVALTVLLLLALLSLHSSAQPAETTPVSARAASTEAAR